ncbi:biosynthetic arginine decarboxylase [Candidatus Riflebacteria bacterium]
MTDWNIKKSLHLYKIPQWGLGFFDINENGNLIVRPATNSKDSVDLKLLIDELRQRKIEPPILLRFMDILHDRIRIIHNCFYSAIDECNFNGSYHPIFPIKVNQQKHVIEGILKYGKKYGLGLEAGSKAELLAILALAEDPNIPIICNGYKDTEFVALVVMAHKMGKKIFPVIEKFSELECFINVYKKTGIIPNLGIRVKLTTKGAGQWAMSAGDNSKFGLRATEIMEAMRLLKEEKLLSSLKLLHFHIGSQIPRINRIKRALTEAGRIFVELYKEGAPLEFIDVGGGLGVEYSGETKNSMATINYSAQEYANDVVYRILQLCDSEKIPHPTIYSESGRFLSAHYSLLVTNISNTSKITSEERIPDLNKAAPQPMHELKEILDLINEKNYQECYHDSLQYKTESLNLFNLGYMSLRERAVMEKIFWSIMNKIKNTIQELRTHPSELKSIEEYLADTYFANFSIFQSLPDSWALHQIFPVIPIHRLHTEPTRNVVVVDLTCDSDGKISKYIGSEEKNKFIKMHQVNGDEPYYFGVFLIGAYQETLGEMHNLFGDTNAVQVEIDGKSKYKISHVIKGDTVKEVLEFVSYNNTELIEKMRRQVESAVQEKKLNLEDSAKMMDIYEFGLAGYTYLED